MPLIISAKRKSTRINAKKKERKKKKIKKKKNMDFL
jgi:hypothetical protein